MDLFTFEDLLVVYLKSRINKTVCLYVCLSVCLFICRSVCLSVCLYRTYCIILGKIGPGPGDYNYYQEKAEDSEIVSQSTY